MKLPLLAQLAKLISNYRPEQITLLEKGGQDKASLLYTYLLENPGPTKEEAAQAIYGKASDATFRKLKVRVEDKLMSMLFFIDLRSPKFSSSLRSMTECYRQMAIFFILLRFSLNDLAIPFAEKLIRKARENDQVEILLPVLSALRLHYAAESFNYKRSAELKEELTQVKQIIDDRHYTEELYCDIYSLYSRSRASQKEQIESIMEMALPEIMTIKTRSESFFVQRRCYNILVLYAQISGDIQKSFDYCDQALDYFVNRSPINSKVTILNYLIQKVVLNIRVKKYDSGILAFDRGIELTSEFTRDWNVFYYLKFLLAMHCKRYLDGIETYNVMRSRKNTAKLVPYLKELYFIHEAYVHFVAYHQKHQLNRNLTPTRYLNNIPSFTSDKKGNNVTILIGHFLLLIIREDYPEAVDRVDALKQYAHRYLKDKASVRSRLFIKMLISITRGHFHPVAVEKHAAKYVRDLHKTEDVLSEQSIELEIIPYEDQWTMLMEILQRRQEK